jgi:transcription factor CRZ1
MDQQNPQARGRSPSTASTNRQPHIKNSHSPEPARFSDGTPSSVGLGLGIGAQPDYSTYNSNNTSFLSNQQAQSFSQPGLVDPSTSFDPNQSFAQQLADDNPSFGTASQGGFLGPSFNDNDFTIYPPTTGEQFDNTPLFGDNPQLGASDSNMMAQASHNATPPHLLKPEPSSANHSPNFNQHQFSSSPGRHSRNVSLGPEAALLPGQVDWSQHQYQGHRRSPSEYSDVSSVAPSPHLGSSDNFDQLDHSPMQRPQDASVYQELHGIGSFSLSEHGSHSPHQHGGRSPSHSPAISPRILPQQLSDMNQSNQFMLQAPNNNFGQPAPYIQAPEAFPQLQQSGDMSGMMAPPSINIDYAPTAAKIGFDQPKSVDTDSLLPPEQRGMRKRAIRLLLCFSANPSRRSSATTSESGYGSFQQRRHSLELAARVQ